MLRSVRGGASVMYQRRMVASTGISSDLPTSLITCDVKINTKMPLNALFSLFLPEKVTKNAIGHFVAGFCRKSADSDVIHRSE